MQRRTFLHTAVGAMAASLMARQIMAAAGSKPRILLRSSWQIVNIGDIAHTPGVITLIERYLPDAEVKLWSSGDLTPEVAAVLTKRFPKLEIVKGSIGSDGKGSNESIDAAVRWCDFLLHGSGPSLVGARDVVLFDRHIGKPFGIYGITYGGSNPQQIEVMSKAKFAYFRDTVSLAKAKQDGIASPVMEFGPDGAFACDLRNENAADEFLEQSGLEPGKFACCIPRLRFTPYWLIKEGRAFDEKKDARNQEMEEHDHAPLREAITKVVKETDLKVLLCPEDMTQVAVGKRMIYDRLPDDIKSRVVWRDSYWLTDLALSTYLRSAGMFGLEMHSPIMCIGNGIPAIVCRFSEQTSKGFMWRDISLGHWLFDADDEERMQVFVPTVLSMLTDRTKTEAAVKQAQAIVTERQQTTMGVLKDSLAAVANAG